MQWVESIDDAHEEHGDGAHGGHGVALQLTTHGNGSICALDRLFIVLQ